MRKRINISVSEATYEALKTVTEEYKFKTVCELASTLLTLFLNRAAGAECASLDEDEVNEIDEMFAELMDYEPTPNNTNVPKIHRQRRR